MVTEFKQIIIFFKNRWLNDIRFWILLFFILRLYGITNAPLEIGHNWRQSLTNMIARNFLQIDNNILYPRIDVDGNKTGIMATEFPFYNYLIYLTAKVFGYEHWYGRLINLIISSVGILYFYKILKRFFNEQLAFSASLILLSSIWFAFSRKSMPDTFCVSIVIIGIYNGLRYLYEKRLMNLVLFFIFSSLGVLCKIPALYLLSVLILPLFDNQIGFYLKRNLVIVGILILIVIYTWYFYWVPHLLAVYGIQLYFPKEIVEGFKELVIYLPDTFEKFYFSALESFVAFGLFLIGLFLIIKQKQKIMFLIFVISSFFFILFICKTGYVFSTHSYYIIPYVPIMALIVAFALEQIKKSKLKTILIFIVIVEAILNQQNDFRIKDSEKYKLEMESVADKFSTRNDLIAINGGQNPQEIYFLNRRGWSFNNEKLLNIENINDWKLKGCKYIFIDKHQEPIDLSKSFKVIYNDKNFIVYSLVN
jgi:hypothetical protein